MCCDETLASSTLLILKLTSALRLLFDVATRVLPIRYSVILFSVLFHLCILLVYVMDRILFALQVFTWGFILEIHRLVLDDGLRAWALWRKRVCMV